MMKNWPKKPLLNPNRSQFEILFEILACVLSPQIFSHIMYVANLNSKKLKELLSLLIDKEMVEVLPKARSYGNRAKERYVITEPGQILLTQWRKLLSLWNGDPESSL